MPLSKIHLPPKSSLLVIPRVRWLHPDMTEKLFSGKLSKENETKRNTCRPELARTPGFGKILPRFLHFFSENRENILNQILFGLQDIQ